MKLPHRQWSFATVDFSDMGARDSADIYLQGGWEPIGITSKGSYCIIMFRRSKWVWR